MKINWKFTLVVLALLLWASGVLGAPKQKQPDKKRVIQIQSALIDQGYLGGTPSGIWDQQTQSVLGKIAADHGWQSRHIPDARVLNILGLGASTTDMYAPTKHNDHNIVEEEINQYDKKR